jgi:hypothetical protein
MSLWKRTTVIVILMTLLTPVSGDYKLLSMFLPIYLFVNEEEKNKSDLLFTIIFSLLLIPKNLRFIHGLYGGVIIDPIILVILLLFILFRFGENKKASQSSQVIPLM